jgi:hypothetical protein
VRALVGAKRRPLNLLTDGSTRDFRPYTFAQTTRDITFRLRQSGGPYMPSSRAPLLAPSPLRTGLEVSHSSGSSTQKRPHEKRGRSLIQNEADLRDTDLLPIRTTVENPPTMCEAAPTGCPVVICFASCIGSLSVLEWSTNRKSAPFPAR